MADFLYIGLTKSSPVKLIKIRLSDFTRISDLSLVGTEFRSLVIDTVNQLIYATPTNVNPSVIRKIDLNSFSLIDSLTLNTGEFGFEHGSLYDSLRNYLYLGDASGNPAKIVRINLNTFSRIDRINLPADEPIIRNGKIDKDNNFAYFCVRGLSDPNRIKKINLSNFTVQSTLVLDSGDSNLWGAAIDTNSQFLYFSTTQSPSKIIKINLSTFTKEGSITLASGRNSAYSLQVDYNYLYVGVSNGYIVRVRLSDFTVQDELLVEASIGAFLGTAIDLTNGFLYAGSQTSPVPAKIYKINLSNFTIQSSLTLQTGEVNIESIVIDPILFIPGVHGGGGGGAGGGASGRHIKRRYMGRSLGR